MSDTLNSIALNGREEFEARLNALVDKEKTPGIDAILEVTYSKYPKIKGEDGNEYVFNKDVFEKFAGYKMPENGIINFSLLHDLFHGKIAEVTSSFLDLIDELKESNYYNDDKNKEKILTEAIEYNLKLLDLAREGFVFEMEKAGFKHGLSSKQVEEKIARLEELEADIFGGKIIENKEESELCFQFMRSKMQSYKDMSDKQKESRIKSKVATRILTQEEKTRLEGYLEKIESALGEKGYDTNYMHYTEKNNNSTTEFLSKYGNRMISREVYADMFQKCINLLGLPQKVRITSVAGIYDGPEYLDIPDNEKYETLPLKRVMKLISHEIMGHYVNQKVHEDTFGKARGAGNVEKEEGLAKFLDTVVLGGDVTGVHAIVPNVSRILAGEILSPNEFEDFVDLYGEISEKKSAANTGTILRHKRNYPLDYVGVQHKDVTYSRGLIKVVNFLQNGGSIHDLFQGKFSIEDIENELTGNKDIKLGKNGNIFNPVLITDIILFFLIARTSEGISFTHSGFENYLEEKYGKYIGDDDIKKEQLSQISKSDLRKVFAIISPLLESIEDVSTDTREKVDKVLSN